MILKNVSFDKIRKLENEFAQKYSPPSTWGLSAISSRSIRVNLSWNMNLCRFEELLHFNYTGFISFKSTLLQSCNFGRSRTIFLKSSFLQNACGSGVQRERKG